jgi:hypothetical protein
MNDKWKMPKEGTNLNKKKNNNNFKDGKILENEILKEIINKLF